MAEKSRRGAVDVSAILMLMSFAAIGFFMYWLQGQAAIERAASVVEETTETVVDDPFAAATTILASDIQTGAGAYEGQLVRMANMDVAGTLGRQGFWLDLPQSPFLVSFSPSLLADSATVSVGSTVTVTGTVMAMSDSVAASWMEAGRIGEGDQLAASFASHFVEAARVETARSSGGGGGAR